MLLLRSHIYSDLLNHPTTTPFPFVFPSVFSHVLPSPPFPLSPPLHLSLIPLPLSPFIISHVPILPFFPFLPSFLLGFPSVSSPPSMLRAIEGPWNQGTRSFHSCYTFMFVHFLFSCSHARMVRPLWTCPITLHDPLPSCFWYYTLSP